MAWWWSGQSRRPDRSAGEGTGHAGRLGGRRHRPRRTPGGTRREPWAPRRSISIAVTDGVVELDGVVFDVRERDALRVAAENVPGVKRVDNRLVCIEPNSGMLMVGPEDEDGRTVTP